jgi:predicted Rossmann fold flavoprotein
LRVLIVEKSNKLLSKVKISGGGRCNVTHSCFEIPELVKKYPRGQNFLKKAFHHFSPGDTIEWFSQRGVQLKTEPDGRMFPVTDDSQTVIDCLLREANRLQVEILLGFDVKQVEVNAAGFILNAADGRSLSADKLCIACGGYPKKEQFAWLLQSGHTIESPLPSLFTFNIPNNPVTQLMGISVPAATVKIAGTKLTETAPLLITHWGLSGPAILRLSAWGARELAEKNYHFTAIVNWIAVNEQQLRDQWDDHRRQMAAQKMNARNPLGLPQRLWSYLLIVSGINEETKWAELPAALQNNLIRNLTAQSLEVKGKTTFKEEFVTCGGISLKEIDVNTMQSRLVPNLYFAGEIMDVDGITGGFNFQHAWTSGYIAAKAIAAAH